MGEEPDRIRAEIEQTRAEMRETVDALGYKADVKARAKENLQDKKESAKESIMGVKDKIVGRGQHVATASRSRRERERRTPDAEQVKHQARRAKSVAQENPLGLAIGSVAVGFLAGMLIPSTRVEDEKLGEVSDNVIEKVKETGQEALEHGKQVAQDAAAERAGDRQGERPGARASRCARVRAGARAGRPGATRVVDGVEPRPDHRGTRLVDTDEPRREAGHRADGGRGGGGSAAAQAANRRGDIAAAATQHELRRVDRTADRAAARSAPLASRSWTTPATPSATRCCAGARRCARPTASRSAPCAACSTTRASTSSTAS